jgi:parvulin-like peptidyl-prolyl isomerase
MHFKKILFTILILSSVGALSCSDKVDEDILAKINDHTIDQVHFENAFREYYYRTGQAIRPSKSTRLAVLNAKFENYVLATYAEDLLLDETEEAYQKKGEIRRKVLNEEYLEQVILSDISVSDEELSKYFVRFNTTLKASHLFAHDLETANTLYERLKNGETFENLAKEVFQTPYLANNGGDIGRFTTDEMDIAFEEAAFELGIGEISKPVPTAQGFSIIKLTDRFIKPILTKSEFANRKDQIQTYVYKKKRELATRQHIYDFETGLIINEEVFDWLWDYMNENYTGAISKDPEFLNDLASDKLLASYQGYELDLNNFANEYRFTPFSQINAIEGKKGFRAFVVGTALRGYLLDGALSSKIDEQELVQESINETYYMYLATEALEYLKNSIKNTDSELQRTFKENQERFYKPLQVNLSRIVVGSESEALEVIRKYELGADFVDLLQEHTILNEDLMINGELGFETLHKYGSNGPDIAKLSIGELSEPINYMGEEYTIYRMNERIEGHSLSFEEAKESVNVFLTNKKLKLLKERTIEEVKKKHDALIDIEKLNKIIIQI